MLSNARMMRHAFVKTAGLILAAAIVTPSAVFSQDAEEKPPPKPIFPDKNLEKAVRKFVFEKRHNEEPITAEDVKDLSTIKGNKMGIRDLSGLEHCVSLASLDLAHNDVSDLAPIANLRRLQYLDLSDNAVEDIQTLSTLPALQYVELSTNAVVDIAPLTVCTNLNSLYLSHNKIEDIAPVVRLPKLWSLYLDNNRLDNISGVYNLRRLSTLSVRNNRIKDISPLFGLTDLYFLFLENNEIEDLGALCMIIDRDHQGEKRFSPYVKIYVKGNPLDYRARRTQLDHIRNCGSKIFF